MKALGLLEHHPEAWRGATQHPFLDAVREGALPAGVFEAWLTQDYLFAADLLVFQSRRFARALRSDQAVLAGGLVAIEAELGWFEDRAGECRLRLEVSRHLTTSEYHDFLIGHENEPYATVITALERAYLKAWRSATPGHPDYREVVEHWTPLEVADYVATLGRAAGSALESWDEGERAEIAFWEVARLERDFWQMPWSAARRGSG